MIETLSGEVPWTKIWHDRMLGNPAFCACDAETLGAYLWLRLIAGRSNNNGSLSVGSAKRMNADQVRAFLRDVAKMPPKRAARCLQTLKRAGLIQVSRAGIVTIAGWKEDQRGAVGAAMRQRVSRARRYLVAFLRGRGLKGVEAESEAGRLLGHSEMERAVSLGGDKASVLGCAEEILAGESNAFPGSPPMVMGGCDPSHLGGVTGHTRTKTETEKEETYVSPYPKPQDRRHGRGAEQPRGAMSALAMAMDVDVSMTGGDPGKALGVLAMYDAGCPPILAAFRLTGAESGELAEWQGLKAENTLAKKWRQLSAVVGEDECGKLWWRALQDTEIQAKSTGFTKSAAAFFQGQLNEHIELRGGGKE